MNNDAIDERDIFPSPQVRRAVLRDEQEQCGIHALDLVAGTR
jgi:hypothetical protein